MSEYIFSDSQDESEYKRLSLLEHSFDEKTQKHLLNAGLISGMNVLEVGLGLGSIASFMHNTVGAKGYVLGIDLDTRFVKDADYEVLQGDIVDINITERFDIIHLRYVLIHNINAKDIIKKLFSLLKPNGKLIIEEPDFTLAKWIDAKEIQACKKVNSAICKMFENKGLKPYYGSTLHLDLVEAGLKIDDSVSYLHLCGGGDDVAEVMAMSTRTLQDEYIHTSLCTSSDIQHYLSACSNVDSLAVYYASIVTIAIKKETDKNNECLPPAETKIVDGIYEAKEEEDILKCFELMHKLRPNIRINSFSSNVFNQMQEGYQLFYLCKNSEIVCLAGVKISTNLAWGKHLFIDDLVSVHSSLGYGKEVLEYLKEMASRSKCESIQLDSGVQRFKAHTFYLREGFKIASHHFSYKAEI